MKKRIRCLILFILISCSPNQEKQYYDNGNIKLSAEVEEGKRDGLVYEYYEDGTIKSKGEWHNGLVHGIVEHYYPSGKLKSSSKWVEGNQNGTLEEYYESGQLWASSTIDDNVKLETIFYYKDGAILEKQRYNDNGELIEVIKFNEEGIKKNGGRYPVYSADGPLKHGKYALTIKFEEPVYEENKVQYNTEIIIGELNEEGSDVIDTITILTGSANEFKHEFRPRNADDQYVSGVINDNYSIGEESFINSFPFRIPFYVARDSIPSAEAP